MVKSFLTLVFVLCVSVLYAQPGDPNDGNPPAPITGLEYLIGGGALIAARHFYKKNKKK